MAIETPQPWPSTAGWLPPDTDQLVVAIVLRAFCDMAICENPKSSNRSGRIDTYNRRAGAPIGSYWCGSWATSVWVDAGADVPPEERASCDIIGRWARTCLGCGVKNPMEQVEVCATCHHPILWTNTPQVGNLVLYTDHARLPGSGDLHLHHVGLLIRHEPYLVSAEGNTSYSGFSRNGEAVLVKLVDSSRVAGYVRPRRRRAATS